MSAVAMLSRSPSNPPSSTSSFETIPCSARGSSPALAVPVTHVEGALEDIEALSDRGSGSLVFSDRLHEIGRVMLERGRVCWAVAHSMHRRLTDILRHQSDPPLESRVVESVYLRCRVEEIPLGEALVASGIVSPHGLRSALRQHNAEAIAVLSTVPSERTFRDHGVVRYNARFTFSTVELLASIGALTAVDAARLARTRLKQVLSGRACGVAFLRHSGARVLPIGAVDADRLGVRGLSELGQWVSGVLDLSEALTRSARLVATTHTSGCAAVAWLEDYVAYAVLCEDRTGVARTITRAMRS